jgi:hypothetical protein
MFSFYGSSHTKYGSYVLEFLCSLELESSPEYKLAILRNWLVRLKDSSSPQHLDMAVEHIILTTSPGIARTVLTTHPGFAMLSLPT